MDSAGYFQIDSRRSVKCYYLIFAICFLGDPCAAAAIAATWMKLKGDSLSKENDRVIILPSPDPNKKGKNRNTKDGLFSI